MAYQLAHRVTSIPLSATDEIDNTVKKLNGQYSGRGHRLAA
jgi:hypothetical protein